MINPERYPKFIKIPVVAGNLGDNWYTGTDAFVGSEKSKKGTKVEFILPKNIQPFAFFGKRGSILIKPGLYLPSDDPSIPGKQIDGCDLIGPNNMHVSSSLSAADLAELFEVVLGDYGI